jgi:uncharacterized membrane protein YbhN (UPF0104 family)
LLTFAVAGGALILNRNPLLAAAKRLGQVSPGWIVAAAGAEAVSYLAMAELQRLLLTLGGLRLRHRRVIALAWASDAVSASLPVGAPVSAAYTFRQYTRGGATPGLAGWAMAASGVTSTLALVSLGVVGWQLRRPTPGCAALAVAVTVAVLGAVAAVAVVALANATARKAAVGAANSIVRRAAALTSRAVGSRSLALADRFTTAANAVDPIASTPVAGMTAFGLAVVNWTADAAVLALSLVAIGAPLPLCALLFAYVLAQTASSIPVLPGALGVAEASLTLALVCAGVRPGDALAGALTYRFVTYWLQLPVGWVAWAGLHRDAVMATAG